MSGSINPQQLSQPWQQQTGYYQPVVQQPPQQIQQHSGQEISGAYKAYFDQPDSNVPLPIQQNSAPQPYGMPGQQHGIRQYGQPSQQIVDNQYGQPPVGNVPVFPTPRVNMNQRRSVPSQNAWAPPPPNQHVPPPLNAFVGGPPPGNFHREQLGAYGVDNRRSWEDRLTSGGRPSYNRGPGDYRTPGGQAGYRGGYDRDQRFGSTGGRYQARGDRGGFSRNGCYEQQQFQSKNILFFSGLPQTANEQFIHDVFSMEQNDIEANADGSPKIKIYKDAGQSKGECTINFRNEEIAQRIINTYNGQPFPGSEGTMNISFAKFSGGKGGAGRPFPNEKRGNNERNDRQGGQRVGGEFERGPPLGRDYGDGNRGRSGGFSGRGGRDGFGEGGNREERGRKGGLEMRKGDWTCACGNINFAFRRECNSCKAPKPQNASGGYQDFGGTRGGAGGPMRSRGGRGGYSGSDRSRPY